MQCLVCSWVILFFLFVSQNNEETAECGAGRRAEEAWAWGIASI